MRIGFYIHHTTISAGGIFTYTIGILKEIIKSDKIEKIVIITSSEVKEKLTKFLSNPKLELIIINRNSSKIKIQLLLYFLIFTFSILAGKIIRSNKLTKILLHFSNKINPYETVISEKNISLLHVPVQYSPVYGLGVPIIITMHDLQEFHFPDFFSTKEKIYRKLNNHFAIYFSDHIVVSFKHVKNDIINLFKINREKISVCPPPFSESWFLSPNESSFTELSEKYELRKNYLLYPAATWKHKNHLSLINVLRKLIDDGIEIDLVCTGNKTEYFLTIKRLIDELKLSEAVHFLGIVPEEDLIGLYKNAKLVVIPTLYEAGSGPLYEAMRYGIPVICSNVTSLPETVNNNEFVFNPNSMEELKIKIISGIVDEEFRKRNIHNSFFRMKELENKNYAECFISTYNKLLHF